MALPDFFVIGAPKAGTTALHAALARHPELYLSPVKEPKFFLVRRCPAGAHPRPRRRAQRAGVDLAARPVRGAVRRRAGRARCAARARRSTCTTRRRTPRIRALVPEAKLIAVVRDPIDRAYSNWMHLWSDGLEPIADFEAACDAECDRITAGWGLFWHYRRLGLYGEQLEHLLTCFPREQVHVLRYRELVDDPQPSRSTAICAFLGIDATEAIEVRGENTRPFVRPGLKTACRRADRARAARRSGATSRRRCGGAPARPLLWALHAQRHRAPPLPRTAPGAGRLLRRRHRRPALGAITGGRLHRLARRSGSRGDELGAQVVGTVGAGDLVVEAPGARRRAAPR